MTPIITEYRSIKLNHKITNLSLCNLTNNLENKNILNSEFENIQEKFLLFFKTFSDFLLIYIKVFNIFHIIYIIKNMYY
tara:strand:+ start:1826 stop:2062 length:237 start_codon:yes stop_codon:yes gene_type:complete